RLRRVRELLQHINPDAIELSDRTTLIPITDWARKRDVQTTLVAHERIDGVIRAFAGALNDIELADRLNRRAANRVDHLVCTTRFAGEEFDRLDIPYTRIPLGVDLAAFHPRRWSGVWRDQFNAQMILVLCSRLSKEKQPEFALDALKALCELGVDAHLVIAGSGPLEQVLQRRSEALPASMLGFITNRDALARVLASADVLLAPGPIETFGLAALESLASGTPVISNQASAVPEVCGVLGGRALPLDARAWAEGILELTSRVGIRELARERAREFTWRRSAASMLALQGLTTRIDEFA
ncbi:MAG: glycosyltransferase, partial [Actinomycetota bacterium]|nr:glycosyltransferase [Actinomycetota bacterium]